MVQGGYRGAANCELAGKLGLERYAECFADNRIDVGVLPHLTDQDLEKLGVLLGHRREMLHAIAALVSEADTIPQAPGIDAPLVQDSAERRHLTVIELLKAPQRLEAQYTAEGVPIPPNMLDELRRDMARLTWVREQINAIEQARLERLEQAPSTGPHAMVRMLASNSRRLIRSPRRRGREALAAP
jgi:ribosomal protein L29